MRGFTTWALSALLIASALTGCGGAAKDETAHQDVRLFAVLPVTQRGYKGDVGQMVALVNTGAKPHDVGGWQVGNQALALLPEHVVLAPGQRLVMAADAGYFATFYGYAPDYRFAGGTGGVPELKGARPLLKKEGDVVRLLDPKGQQVDVLAYGTTKTAAGWQGEPVQLVDSFPLVLDNQVLTRLRDAGTDKYRTGASAQDWSGGTRKVPGRVFYAGQTDLPALTTQGTAKVIGAAAPDNAFTLLMQLIDGAQKELKLVTYETTEGPIGEHLMAAATRGVDVTVVMEHDPVGGLRDSDKQWHAQMAKGGVKVTYLVDFKGDFSSRYNMYHNKYALVDGKGVLVTSGNLTRSSFPDDLTCGNREFAIYVENPTVVGWFQALYAADVDPAHHKDMRAYDPKLDSFSPPSPYDPGPCFPYTRNKQGDNAFVQVQGNLGFELIVSPDNTLSRDSGILGAIRKAKTRILQSHQYVDVWWGKGSLATSADPLLEELIAAARRGVHVEVLLDVRNAKDATSPTGQVALINYVNSLRANEKLPLEVRLVNQSGSGVGRTYHNKSLVIDDDTVIVSSVNGSENSFRYARETALKVSGSQELNAYFGRLFAHDWDASARPNSPANLVAQPRVQGFFLDWTLNLEPDVTGYKVYWRSGAGAQWQLIKDGLTKQGITVTQNRGEFGVTAVGRDAAESDKAIVVK